MIDKYKKHSIMIPNVYRVMTINNKYKGLIMCETKEDYDKMIEKWGDKTSYNIDDWTMETVSELFSMLTMLKKNYLFNKYHIDMLNIINLKIKKKQFHDNSIDLEEMANSNYSILKQVLEKHGYKLTKLTKTAKTKPKKEGEK